MTIEQIKAEIATKQNAIEILKDDIRDLQQQWISLSGIKVGDKLKMTNLLYNKQVHERIGIVNNIDISWDDERVQYNCYPTKKNGEVAKVGLFYNNSSTVIEKL